MTTIPSSSPSPSITPEDMKELEGISFGFGYPYARLLILKELIYLRNNLRDKEDHAQNREVLDGVIAKLQEIMMRSTIGNRAFKSSLGDVYLAAYTRGDRLLYGAHPNTPYDHVPVDESEEVTIHRTILSEVAQELFTYVDVYISLFMEKFDPVVYRLACDLLSCDRLTTVVEEVTVPLRIPDGYTLGEDSEAPHTIKKCLCLGLLRDVDQKPRVGRYFLGPSFAYTIGGDGEVKVDR